MKKIKFSIRYKFLILTSLLLAGCVALYLYLAITIFKSDKQELVFDLNRSMVTNISSELETQFLGLADKIEIFALMGYQKVFKKDAIDELIQRNSDIVFVSFVRQPTKDAPLQFEKTYLQDTFLKTYGVKKDYFTKDLFERRNINIQEVLNNDEKIWNATLPKGPPLIGYARSILIEDERGKPYDRVAVVSFVKAEKILRSISTVDISKVLITTSNGEVLVHKDVEMMSVNYKVDKNDIFLKAFESPLKSSVIQSVFENEKVLGAFSKVYNGKIFVIAASKEKQAFAIVANLVRRSLIFSLIVLTVAFMAAVVFSKSLTRPLELLTTAMDRVSDGDLSTHIEIKTKDEIEFLSSSFNNMIEDLRASRQELENINKDLESKVKERTNQLEKQNQAVKEAQEALLKTTRLAAVGEIAGRAAHEVLNPLTSMMTRLQNIQKRLQTNLHGQINALKEIKSAWQQDYTQGGFEQLTQNWQKPSTLDPHMSLWQEDIQNIDQVLNSWKNEIDGLVKDSNFLLDEGARINKIVGRMRSLSVVKSAREINSLNTMLEKCHDIMADLMEKYQITFQVMSLTSDVDLQVDRDEFIQSITNLLRNSQQAVLAIKTTDPNFKASIRVEALIVNDKVEVRIVDNGVGIPEEYQNHLFENHFSTKSKDEGTGLGLNISRRFLRAAGGDITFLKSTPKIETVFVITLPYIQKQGVAA